MKDRFKTRILDKGASEYFYEDGMIDYRPIAHLRLDNSPFQVIETNIEIDNGSILLDTIFVIKPHTKKYSHLTVSQKRLKPKILSRYENFIISENQLFIEDNEKEEEHDITKNDDEKSGNGNYTLRSIGVFDKPSKLIQLLSSHSFFLENFFSSMYENDLDVPEMVYTINLNNGRDLESRSGDSPDFFMSSGNQTQLRDLEKKFLVQNPKISFDDIGGNHKAKLEMQRIYDDILFPELAAFLGRDANKSRGYLISGESGCGKTLLVRALATKLIETFNDKVKFYAANYNDITSIYRGGEAKATAQLFELANENGSKGIKTLLFLDEIQSLGIRQKEFNEGLDTLLSHLDGINRYEGLTFIGATYMNLDSIDPALKRRLGNHISISNPNQDERSQIIQIHIDRSQKIASMVGNNSLFDDIDLNLVSEKISGFNGSKIERLIEKSIQEKEDEIRQKLSQGGFTREDLEKVFTPINTDFILSIVPQISKEGKGKISSIGF